MGHKRKGFHKDNQPLELSPQGSGGLPNRCLRSGWRGCWDRKMVLLPRKVGLGILEVLLTWCSVILKYVSCQHLDDDDEVLFSEYFWGRTSDVVLGMNIVQFWLLKQIVWEKGVRQQASISRNKQQTREQREEFKQTWVLLSWKAFRYCSVQPVRLLHAQQCPNSSLRWIKGCDVHLLCAVCTFAPWGKLIVHSIVLIWQTLSNTNPVGVSEDRLKCALALEQKMMLFTIMSFCGSLLHSLQWTSRRFCTDEF